MITREERWEWFVKGAKATVEFFEKLHEAGVPFEQAIERAQLPKNPQIPAEPQEN